MAKRRRIFLVFSSLKFIFIFMPVFFLIYALVPGNQLKNAVLFLGSIIFYSRGVLDAPVYILLFLQTIVINYALGRMIEDTEKHKKLLLIIGIVYNSFWLLFFKYSTVVTIELMVPSPASAMSMTSRPRYFIMSSSMMLFLWSFPS